MADGSPLAGRQEAEVAEVALIVIFVIVFFVVGFTVGVLVVGMIGRWMNGRPRGR